MKITLRRKSAPFHFEATNDRDMVVSMDSSRNIGGLDKGASPMEMILMGLGGCASIDLGLILSKQKQTLDDFELKIIGERDDTPAKAFKSIQLDYTLYGNLDESKIERALDLTLNKYCSVALSLSKSITVSYSFKVIKTQKFTKV